jgi:hypothetical protein
MAIARVGSPTTAAMTAGATTITVSVPAGVVNGNLLLLCVWGDDATGVITDPAGWTLDSSAAPASGRGKVYRRIASSEPASYAVTVTSNKYVAVMAAYSGVNTTTPFSASSMKNEAVAGTSHTTNSVTPGSVNDWLVSFFGDRQTTAANKNTGWAPTAPAVERGEVNNNTAASSPWSALECNDSNGVVGSTSPASHTSTATVSSTANAFMWVAALNPAAAAGGVAKLAGVGGGLAGPPGGLAG